MPITAGDAHATLTLDTSGFSKGVVKAQSELATLTTDGRKLTNAFGEIENRMGSSASAIAQAIDAAGNGSTRLTDMAVRADRASAKVELLTRRANEAAQTMLKTQSATQASANALALLQESADASAENLQWAKEHLQELGQSSQTTAEQLRQAQEAMSEFKAENSDLNAQLEKLHRENDKNETAARHATDRYDALKLQLSGAEGAAERATAKFEMLALALSGSGDGVSLKGLVGDISSLGSSALTSASRSLGTIAVETAGIGSNTAVGTIAAAGLGKALASLAAATGPVGIGLAAAGAAAIYVGKKLYDANAATEDFVENWDKTYEVVDAGSLTAIVNGQLVLNTDGLANQVDDIYSKIGEALTDGKPDTQQVIDEISGNSQQMFQEVRNKIQEWYDSEMANLDLSTPEGLAKAVELREEYDGLISRVNELDENTGAWITTYAGKSTEAVTEALTQLEGYKTELEKIAQRTDELTALLQSDQKAAYTTVTQGLTADIKSVGNAILYAKTQYAIDFQFANEDHDAALAALWQEYQEKLQNATNEQEALELKAEYELKLKQENTSYAETQNALATEYKVMIHRIVQGAAEALSKSDPGLREAIEKVLSGDFSSLSELNFDNAQFAQIVKGLIESGTLAGVTDADLTDAKGQMQALVNLLGTGNIGNVELPVFQKKTIFGPAEIDDPTPQLRSWVAEIQRIGTTVDIARNSVDDFKESVDIESGDYSGAEHMAKMFDQLNTALAMGDVEPGELGEKEQAIANIMAILGTMDTEHDYSFLEKLSIAMNGLGYNANAENVVFLFEEIWNAYNRLGEMIDPPWWDKALKQFASGGAEAGVIFAEGASSSMQDMTDISAASEIAASLAGDMLVSAFGDVDTSGAGEALMDSAATGLNGVEGDFDDAGNNAGEAFVSELRDHISAAASAATAIGSAAYNALKASLEIRSPSRKMRKLGAYTGEGYALGISDEIAASEASIRRLAGATVKAASGAASNSYHNAISINLNNANLRSEADIRKLARQLGSMIGDANYGLR